MTGAAPIINTTEKTEKTRQLTDHVDIISGMKSEIPRTSFRNAKEKGEPFAGQCYHCGQMEHKAPDCSKGKSFGKGDIVCDNCGMKANQRSESLMKGNGKGGLKGVRRCRQP